MTIAGGSSDSLEPPPGAELASAPASAGPKEPIVAAIEDFVGRSADPASPPDPAEFDRLALAALRFQCQRVAPYRALCEHRGRLPERLAHWSEAPPVPASAFKSLELCAAPAQVVFRSSGTSRGRGERSVHYHPYPELYRTVIDASFPWFCLPEQRPLPTLSLIPPLELAPDSSLAFMADHILRRHSRPPTACALTGRGVELERVERFVAELGERPGPVLVLATALALLELARQLAERGRPLALPPGTVVFETGGFKGHQRTITRSELLELTRAHLEVPASRIVREYGMTELTSQAYSRVLFGEDPDVLVAPPWLRVGILDPQTLAPRPQGEPGLIALFDLANVGSALMVLTEDLGVAAGPGFRLLGRAAGAELRGCSLTAEELSRARRDGPPGFQKDAERHS